MAANITFVIHKGTDFTREIQVKDNGSTLNITGYTFDGKIAEDFHTTTTTSFTTAITHASTGKFTISLTDAQTTALTAGEHVYTVTMTSDTGVKTRVAYGVIDVKDEV